jgi:cytosine/adenosine deaminase-related metal-dependent hydrolase
LRFLGYAEEVAGTFGEVAFVAVDVPVGMLDHPGMIDGRMVRHEVQNEQQSVGVESFANASERVGSAEFGVQRVVDDAERRADDMVFTDAGSAILQRLTQRLVFATDASRGFAGLPYAEQPDILESLIRPGLQLFVRDVGQIGCAGSIPRLLGEPNPGIYLIEKLCHNGPSVSFPFKVWCLTMHAFPSRMLTARYILLDADTLLADGAIVIRSGRIEWVGRRSDCAECPSLPETDCGSVVLAPGLVNSHSHLDYTGHGPTFKPESFVEWLRHVIETKNQFDYSEEMADSAIRTMIASGTTSAIDISSSGRSLRALSQSGLRHLALLEVIGISPPEEKSFSALDERLKSFSGEDLGRVGLSPHAPYSVSRELMQGLRERFYASRGCIFSMHLAESRSERLCIEEGRGALADLFRRRGIYPPCPEPLAIAESYRDFVECGRVEQGARDILVHGNFLRDGEVEALAESGCHTLVICPGTREFFGVRSGAVRRARRFGLPLAIGTDSLMSNDGLDMWVEMRRARCQEPDWPTWDIFRAATEGGARALGMEKELGAIRKGYWADLMAISLEPTPRTALSPRELISRWLSAPEPPKVRGTWIAGRSVAGDRLNDRF